MFISSTLSARRISAKHTHTKCFIFVSHFALWEIHQQSIMETERPKLNMTKSWKSNQARRQKAIAFEFDSSLHSSRRHHAAISNERGYEKSPSSAVVLFHFNGRKWHMGHHLITLTHSFEACSHIKPTGTIFHLHFQHFVRALFVFVESLI